MARALVTGANGFIGRAVCARLSAEGWKVRGVLRRREESVEPASLEECSIVESIGPDTDWSSALADVEIVVHLAARVHVMREKSRDPLADFRHVNTAGTARLARCASEQGVRRIVFLSSVGIHGSSSERTGISEEHPIRPHDAYTRSKWEAEEELGRVSTETGMETVVLRCPLVYGPRNPGNFLRLISLIQRGVPLPFAGVRNERSFIFVGNVAHAVLTCATHPDAARQAFLVSDGEPLSTPNLIRRIAQVLERPAHLFPCPLLLLKALGKLAGRGRDVERLLGTLVVDTSKIRTRLGWMPPVSVSEGLRVTADWYRGQDQGGPGGP